MNKHTYPSSVVGANERAEYDDAFIEGEADNADGAIRNDYARGSAGWHGYKAGVSALQPVRENWEAQTHYDVCWNSLPDLPGC